MIQELDIEIERGRRCDKIKPLFAIVGRQLFDEWAKDDIAQHQGLARTGYMSFFYKGLPVLWNDALCPRGVLVINADLLEALKAE